MGEAEKFSAEGKAYATAAREREDAGKTSEARSLYLKAAQSFLDASKASVTKDDRALRQQMAQTFYGKATSLTPQSKRMGGGGSGKGGEGDGGIEVVPIEKPSVNFSSVAGLDGVKEDIKKAIVYPFQHPELYEKYRKKIGEGILMYGPPGCGKTFVAKATAGECNAAFITLKIGDILSKWLGESEKNLRNVFEAGRKYQPSIIFFDEVDGLGGRRDDQNDAARRVVNALLAELDGITSGSDKRLTLAATNAPWDVDPALRRPGRFSKLLFLPPPDLASRTALFKLYTKERPLASDVHIPSLAERTDGYSSADITQICEEASDVPLMEALAGKAPRTIAMADFQNVLSKRRSSIIPWFRLCREQVEKSGERDLYPDMMAVIDKYDRAGMMESKEPPIRSGGITTYKPPPPQD